MKRLNEIQTARGNAEPDDANLEHDLEWEKDKLIASLEEQGHKTISVDRAVIVIEQCDQSDEFPNGWSSDPLRITIYPDPDAGFSNAPHHLYLHAGRSGLMDVYLSGGKDEKVSRLIPFDRDMIEGLLDSNSLASARAILSLADVLGGYYSVESSGGYKVERDQELEALGGQVREAIQRYIKRLETFPRLFKGWPDERE